MIAFFHSPVIGQSGCTSSAAAISCVASSKFKQDTLVIQLRDNITPIEKQLFKKELDALAIKTADYTFDDSGIDALLRRVSFSTLQKEDFVNCSINTLTGNDKLSVIGVTKKKSIEQEVIPALPRVIELLKRADVCYDLVIVILPPTHSDITRALLSVRDLDFISVMCVPQSIAVINTTTVKKNLGNVFMKRKKEPEEENKQNDLNTVLLMGNTDVESKYSAKNIAAAYGFKQGKVCSILHDAHFKDSISQGDVYNFVMKNLENDIDDDLYNFSRYLIETAGKIMAQAPKEGKIIYTTPLPDKNRFMQYPTSQDSYVAPKASVTSDNSENEDFDDFNMDDMD